MAELRMLAIAAASGRVGYVFLVGDRLRDWRVSGTAFRSTTNAAEQVQRWINDLKPEVVATEKIGSASRKGEKAKAVIAAASRTAEHNYLMDVSVERPNDYANKYEEAEALAKRYPEIVAWLPKKRRFFDNEPRNTVLFEALALAEQVMRGPSTSLAAAMG